MCFKTEAGRLTVLLFRLATYGMKQLPPDVILQIQSNTLWSKEEESILAKTPAVCSTASFVQNKILL